MPDPVLRPSTSAAPSFWDIWSHLLWPRVLTGAAYGLRPGRLGLAFFALIISAVLLSLGSAIDNAIRQDSPAAAVAPEAAPFGAQDLTREPLGFPSAALPSDAALTQEKQEPWHIPWRTFIAAPLALVMNYPVTALLFGPLTLFLWLLMVGAISRIAACEIALDRQISWWEGLSFAARSWKALLGATLGPIVAVWIIGLLVALFGLILLRWPVANIFGAILFPLALILSFIAAAIALIYLLGMWLITPAIMADGADSIDAIQRAYAYVIDRPARLIIYLLLAAVGLIAITFLTALFLFATIYFAGQASALWAGEAGRTMIWSGIVSAARDPLLAPVPIDDPEGTYHTGATIIRFWTAIPILLILAAILSGLTAASTMVYLAMRRLCDGQDLSEIWWPGRVESAMAASMAARAAASPPP